MRGKLLFLAGAAAGFVLGSKAGRQAYEQIRTKANEVWGSEPVQKTVSQAGQVAKDAATLAQSKVADVMNHATDVLGEAAQTGPGHEASSDSSADSMPETTSGTGTGTGTGTGGTGSTTGSASGASSDSSPGSSNGGHG
jgi:hypothetical protein